MGGVPKAELRAYTAESVPRGYATGKSPELIVRAWGLAGLLEAQLHNRPVEMLLLGCILVFV
jgi:hypothetical protein